MNPFKNEFCLSFYNLSWVFLPFALSISFFISKWCSSEEDALLFPAPLLPAGFCHLQFSFPSSSAALGKNPLHPADLPDTACSLSIFLAASAAAPCEQQSSEQGQTLSLNLFHFWEHQHPSGSWCIPLALAVLVQPH